MTKNSRTLNTYSEYMTVDIKEANKMHYRVKGHLIPDEWEDSDIIKMYDGYFKRMWGNNEGGHCDDDFEAGIPESFNVLIKELKSLGLNVNMDLID